MAYTSYPSTSLVTGVANTKGSYVQIVASTPYASSRLYLTTYTPNAAARAFLIDLATGAAAAETDVVANVACHGDGDALLGAPFVALDVDLPAGTRLAVRAQCPTATATCVVGVLLEDRALGSLATPVTYGATDLAFSRGTIVDPGTTINTKGSYAELTASTTARHDALLLCLTTDFQTQAITALTTWRVDVATGAAGAETVVLPDLVVQANTATDSVRPGLFRLPVAIPAGTRLAVRCQCTRNTALERRLRVILIGMQEPATGGGAAGAVAYVG